MAERPFRYPLWARGDLDGFFGLMVDNLVQVLLIVAVSSGIAHLSPFLIYQRVLPGVAVSLLIGNLFYGIQAHVMARRHRNPTCTALPYGINTPSVIAYVLFIMGPVYERNVGEMGEVAAGELAWKAGLIACLVSGVIEFLGAFFAERLRQATPRAALLGVLAAVGVAFIAGDFALRIYTHPLVGLLPLAVLLLAYFARFSFPLRLPGGFLAILFGTLIAWGTTLFDGAWFGSVQMSAEGLRAALSPENVRWIQPVFVGGELWALLRDQTDLLLIYLTVSIPMGVINVLGALQNIESAEAAGDHFSTGPSLAVNGLGSIAAGLFGSCFPTTIYIGHPGWKMLGARGSYSVLNGVFFTIIFLFGLGPFLAQLIPIEAGAAIVMYIGIIITAQAFQATPKAHAPAVAIALFPALAALVVVKAPLLLSDMQISKTLADLMQHPEPLRQIPELPGLLALTGANSGWIVITLVLAAIGAELIDRRYRAAGIWAGAACILTIVGATHAYRLEGNVLREYFIWQKVEAVHLHAPSEPADEAPRADARETARRARARPPRREAPAEEKHESVVAYRALPIAVGYGLASLLFFLAALRRPEPVGAEAADEEPDSAPEEPPPRAAPPQIPYVDFDADPLRQEEPKSGADAADPQPPETHER